MFICGAFTKLTDNFVDEPFKARHTLLPYATGLAYGLLAGFLVASSAEFATLIIAITLGVLVAGKIDSKEHQIGIAGLFLLVAWIGLPEISFALVVAFTLLGFFDEFLNDLMDRLKEKKVNVNKWVQKFVSARISLELGTLAVGLLTGNYIYFIAIFSFDIAYNLVDKAMFRFLAMFDASYGSQLVLDLYKCDARKLWDKKLLEKMLNDLPAKVGMHRISEPQIVEYNSTKKEEAGLSGFVLIAESHITIHTYPLKQLAKVDVVSCKKFDHEKLAVLIKKTFGAKEAEVKLLDRGKHYPFDVKKAMKLVENERAV